MKQSSQNLMLVINNCFSKQKEQKFEYQIKLLRFKIYNLFDYLRKILQIKKILIKLCKDNNFIVFAIKQK